MLTKKLLIVGAFAVFFGVIIVLIILSPKNTTKTPQKNSPTPTGVSVLQQKTSPQQKPAFTPIDAKTKNTLSVNFALPNTISFPSSIEKVSVNRTIDDSFINQLKKYFSISSSPQRFGNILFWGTQDSSKSLEINTSSGSVRFQIATTKTTERTIDSSEAERIAGRIFADIGVISVTPNSATVTMISSLNPDGEITTTNPSEAQYFRVTYLQGFRGVPIFYQHAYQGRISALIGKTGELRSLEFFYIQPTDTVKSQLISLSEIEEQIETGNYTIVSIEGTNKSLPPNGTLTIKSLTIGYFDDKKSDFLFPIALLSGTITPGSKSVSLYSSLEKN